MQIGAVDVSGCFCHGWRMEQTSLERLGQLVLARRIELGIEQGKDLADAMGITARVVTDIERGNRQVGPATYSKLEHALHWATGSAKNILAGGEPRKLAVGRVRSVVDDMDLSDSAELHELVAAAVRFGELVRRIAPELNTKVDEYRVLLGDLLLGTYSAVSAQQRRGGDGHADADAGGSASTSDVNELDAEVEGREADTSTRRRGAPE